MAFLIVVSGMVLFFGAIYAEPEGQCAGEACRDALYDANAITRPPEAYTKTAHHRQTAGGLY